MRQDVRAGNCNRHFSIFLKNLPLLEHEKDRTDNHQKSDNVVPPKAFFQIQDRKDREYDKGNNFLDNFKLRCRELIMTDPVRGHLKAILYKGDKPTYQYNLPQG
jgi:hypothetical protein